MALGNPASNQPLVGIYNIDQVPSLNFQSAATINGSLVSQIVLTGGTPNLVNQPVTSATGTTLTAANIIGRLINRSGPTAAFTDTTDTATNIIAAFPSGLVAGKAIEVIFVNNTIYPQTIAAGTGVTLTGISTPIPGSATALAYLTYVAAGTLTLQFVEIAYNAAGGFDPSTVATQFGSGVTTFLEEGNVYRYASGAGISPGSTGNDNVIAVFTLSPNSFDGIGNRGLTITACGSVANNTNAKRMKIYWGCTTAAIGSAVTGGTVIADSGSYTTTGAAGWEIAGNVFKYGSPNSNTQIGIHQSSQIGSTVGALIGPTTLNSPENANILIAITGNATTATTDIVLNWVEINALN